MREELLKMRRWISILSGLLVVQLVLAAVVNLTGEEYGAFEPEARLLVFDRQTVDGLRLEDGENILVLEKRDGKWLLPDNGGFPAEQAGVDRLLHKLDGMKKGWPVATTSGAARRFKVADGQFERKLSLSSGETTLAELYVGTSPGFRKVHVRPADEKAVFAADFNTWEASTKVDDWIDKAILELDEKRVVRVEMPGLALQREDGELHLADLAEGEETNPDGVATLTRKLFGLRIQSVLGTESIPEYRQEAPELEIRVMREADDILSYRFSRPEEASYYVLKRSDLDHYFKVAEFAVDPIKETARDKLVRVGTEKSSETQATQSDVKDTESVE